MLPFLISSSSEILKLTINCFPFSLGDRFKKYFRESKQCKDWVRGEINVWNQGRENKLKNINKQMTAFLRREDEGVNFSARSDNVITVR